MNFLEKDLEQILCETDQLTIQNRGLSQWGHDSKIRQMQLGDYGVADIVTFMREPCYGRRSDYNLAVTVYELKQNLINTSTFLQAVRYVRALQLLERKLNVKHDIEYRIVLIGRIIDLNTDVCYLPSVFPNVSFYTYSYEVDGIHFKEEDGFCLKNYEHSDKLLNQLKKPIKKLFLSEINLPF